MGLLLSVVVFSQRLPERINYVERYKEIAISEMERSGVPASIKLAQALLESNAGKSVLARKANNHFGMKCGSNWDGKTYYREDDDYDEFGNIMKSCFRVYRNAEASFVAHSEFLTDPRKEFRYGFLFRLDPKDYTQWAYGLKRAGYATNPNYPRLLIGLIETYNLDMYDGGALIGPIDEEDVPPLLAGSGIFLINDAKVTLAEAGDTPDEIARRTAVSVQRILRYNEKLDSKGEQIMEGTRVYLQRKRGFFRGRQKWHNVKEGETMYSISQLYGVRVEKLYRKNRMEPGTEPAVGERIKLRWRVKRDEIPRLRTETPPPIDPVDGEDLEMDESDPIIAGEDLPPALEPVTHPPTPTTPAENPNNNNTNQPDNNNPTNTGTIDIEPVLVNPSPTTPDSTPPPATTPIPEVTDVMDEAPQDAVFYKVQRGDTLYRISRQYGTTVDNIKKWNNLTSDLIRSGWMLRVK